MNNLTEPKELNWKEMPMLRLLLPMIAGIVVGIHWKGLPIWVLLSGLAAGGLACLLLTRRRIPYRLRHGYAFACLFFWLVTGAWLSRQYLATGREDYFMNSPVADPVWTGRVTETGGSAFPRAIVQIQGCYSSPGPVSGKLLVYPETPLEKGQILVFRTQVQEIPAPKNPGGFDNKRYRFFQNIHHQAYLKDSDYQIIGKKELHFLERWRSRQVEVWKDNLKDTAVYSVATAMVLGYTEELPDEVRDTYAQTGATHVLSVSGLHVGLIYLLLTALLRRWQSVWLLRKLNFALCLAGIWGFAFLTGASPAVLRAATMFSFVLVGKQLRWKISIFNSLAASAFFLLWINPFWLFHIGFQLSYLALAGIVVFQPLFYKLWIPSNRLLDKIWTLTTVSLGAQLATLPLTIHYFHQFPVYFWLSGLVVVPASPFIIVLGILITLSHYLIPGWIWLPSFLLKELILLMNGALEWMQHLPFSVVENLFIPQTGIYLLFAAVVFLAWIWEQRRLRSIPIFLLALNGVAGFRLVSEARLFFREEIVVYHVHEGTLLDYFYRGNLLTLKSTAVDPEREERAAGFNRQRRQIARASTWFIPGENPMLSPGSFRIKVINAPVVEKSGTSPVDFVLLQGNPEMGLGGIHTKLVIADASNRKKMVEKWKKESETRGVAFVDIRETGAYTISINR